MLHATATCHKLPCALFTPNKRTFVLLATSVSLLITVNITIIALAIRRNHQSATQCRASNNMTGNSCTVARRIRSNFYLYTPHPSEGNNSAWYVMVTFAIWPYKAVCNHDHCHGCGGEYGTATRYFHLNILSNCLAHIVQPTALFQRCDGALFTCNELCACARAA